MFSAHNLKDAIVKIEQITSFSKHYFEDRPQINSVDLLKGLDFASHYKVINLTYTLLKTDFDLLSNSGSFLKGSPGYWGAAERVKSFERWFDQLLQKLEYLVGLFDDHKKSFKEWVGFSNSKDLSGFKNDDVTDLVKGVFSRLNSSLDELHSLQEMILEDKKETKNFLEYIGHLQQVALNIYDKLRDLLKILEKLD